MAKKSKRSDAGWCLESLVNDGKTLRQVSVHPLPFRVGRRQGLDLTLASTSVSKVHAEIIMNGNGLLIRDLRSTNGTFVNRQRIIEAPIQNGDIIHFADFEFRLAHDAVDPLDIGNVADAKTLSMQRIDLTHHFVEGTREFAELMRQRAVFPVFQPIVNMNGGHLAAYEVLGRGRHPELPENPAELFRIAASLGVEAELSQLFVRKAMEEVSSCTGLPPLFLNTHPAEVDNPELPRLIHKIRSVAPHIRIVLEFHESVLDDLPRIVKLRSEFAELGIGLAYDDFGHGRARFYELADVPPDYLKFDIRLVSNIDKAPESRLRFMSSLVSAANDLDIQTIAEGIERQEEADICAELGFCFGQGFLYGRPKPLQDYQPAKAVRHAP
jgi:EAL domain-containing protein (putative c-di-GMP-specific phosphodiesterase class I)